MFDFARPDLKVYALPLLALLVLAMAWSRALPGWGRRTVSWVLRSAVLILCLLALAPLHSRVAPALTLAASLFPGVSERRVLVWTDGRLEEPISSAAEWRAASGARSLVLYPLGLEAPRDVRVVDLQVPSDASVGGLWNAVLSVEATAPGPPRSPSPRARRSSPRAT